MKKLIITILSAAMLCACEFHFEPDIKGRVPILFVECIGGPQDTTVFKYRVAAPYVNERSRSYVPTLSSVDFRINGVAQTVKDSAVICSYKPGDVITLRASCQGAQEIKAQTTVPEIPAVRSVRMEQFDKDDVVYMRFCIDLDDGPRDGCFYGFQLIEHVVDEQTITDTLGNFLEKNVYEGDYSRNIVNPIAEDDLFEAVDNLFVLQIGFDGKQIRSSYNCPMNLCTASELQREGTDVYLVADPDYDNDPQQDFDLVYVGDETDEEKQWEDWENWQMEPLNRLIVTSRRVQYKLIVRSLSPEFYYYAKALYLSQADNLAGMGLSPVNFTYSNVKGGAGLLGAYTSYESEWFDNPYYVEGYTDYVIF